MTLRDDLIAIRDLVQTPRSRAPGGGPNALDADGNEVRVNDPRAVRWNLHGAVIKVCQSPEQRDAVFAALQPETGPSLKEFDRERGQGTVIGALSRAITQAEQVGGATGTTRGKG
jgi:hypothetical protein